MNLRDDLPVRYSEMRGLPIDHGEEPIRLFRSDFMEFFTHNTPAIVLLIWLPVIIWLLRRAFLALPGSRFWTHIPPGILFGLFLWTFAEYMLHRFIFHFHPRSDRMKRLVFLFHGIHHAQPQCKTRLVMPLSVSIPMAFVFYGLFNGIVGGLLKGPAWVDPLFAGFMSGYLIYDLIHYATHHFPMRQSGLKFLKRHHMQHHYKSPGQRFGVSSPLWDVVFGTLPA